MFTFQGVWIENLMHTPQLASHIINLINNNIVFATNDVKISLLTMLAWLRAGTVQAIITNKHAYTAIKLPSILRTTNIIKWERRQLVFRAPVIQYPALIKAIIPQTHNTPSAAEQH